MLFMSLAWIYLSLYNDLCCLVLNSNLFITEYGLIVLYINIINANHYYYYYVISFVNYLTSMAPEMFSNNMIKITCLSCVEYILRNSNDWQEMNWLSYSCWSWSFYHDLSNIVLFCILYGILRKGFIPYHCLDVSDIVAYIRSHFTWIPNTGVIKQLYFWM